MTSEEYQRICDRLARKAIRFAAKMIADEDPGDGDAQREHWIAVSLDQDLPDIDPDVLLSVTSNADAWAKANGSADADAAIRACAAFQADVWDAINRTEAV